MATKCISCKTEILNDTKMTKFACPSCGKTEIIRCGDCRKNGINYKCDKCEFVGP